MRFVGRMLWREIRSSWSRLAFFFLCVGIGVAAIIALRSVVQNVRTALTQEARSLIGADLILQSTRPIAGDVRVRIDRVLEEAGAAGTTEIIETQTMASPEEGRGNGNVKLVELRGVGPDFPYYGRIELEQGGAFSHGLVTGRGAVVQPELLIALGLDVGDTLRLAGQSFVVRNTIARDRAQRGGIAFGPRVYIDVADLSATSLLGAGSRASYQVLARLESPEPDGVTARLRDELNQDFVSVRSWKTLEDRIGRNLTTAENYLSLVGFVIVVLGGIGVWSVTRVIVQQKIRSVAILKCIGATSGRIFSIYVLQVLTLALAGSLLGLGIAAGALALVPASLFESFGVARVSVTASAALQGTAVGLLVSLLFALVPLLEIRHVKPLLLLRADGAGAARQRTWQTWLVAALISGALVAVAMWQADSVEAGLYVTGGLAVASVLLYGAGTLLVRLTRPLARSRVFAVRHAVISLSRPGNQTRVILLSVGLGCFFVLGVRALQTNFLHQIARQVGENSPDFVLIDIQADQVASVQRVAGPFVRRPPRVVPLMRGRVTSVEGRQTSLPDREAIRERGRGLGREFGLTFRTSLESNEQLLDGAFWAEPVVGGRRPDGADTEVSIERDLARQANVRLGDRITFDIAGQLLVARVSSVRAVEWNDSENGGFVFVLRPAPAVERAAHNYVGFLQVRDDPSARGALQREMVSAHPNVSVINVRDVVQSIRGVVDDVTVGVTVVGAVTLFSGVLVLVGAVAMTKFQRLYESAIYRALGAGTRLITLMVAVEYGLLGLLAGVIGAAGAFGLSWVLATYLLDITWQPAGGLLAAGVVATAGLVGAVGVVASFDVLMRKPLSTLRSE
jgi:putative ABC transport system permease protein